MARAADRDRARAVGAHAEGHAAGVAVHHVDRLDRDAQARRHDLREGGLVALAMAVRAGEHGHAAGRMDANLAALEQARARAERARDVRRRDAAGLDVARVADAAQLAGRLAGRLALAVALDLGQLARLVHAGMEVAGVVLQRHRRLVREGGDEVALADLVLAQVHLPGAARDQPLEQVGGLGPAGAAVGIDRCRVGEPGIDLDVDLRRGVLAREQGGVEDGRHRGREGRQVGAEVGIGVDPHREELALTVHRHLGMAHVVAAVRVRQEAFRALGRPLDVAVELLGGPGQAHVLGVEEDLRAEATTHVGRDHAHLVLGQAQHEGRHQQPLDVRVLVRDVERVVVGAAAVAADGHARLDRVGDQPVVDQIELRDVRGAREGGIDRRLVAQRPLVALVVGRLVVDRDAAGLLRRVGHADQCGQHLVLDHHGLGGVLRLLDRLGHHHRDMVADIAHLVDREDRVHRLLHRRAVGVVDQPAAGQPAHLALDVLAAEDADHARHRERVGDVDRDDARMRVRGADEHRVRLVRQRDVVGVVARTGQEPVVFLAPQRVADVRQVREVGGTHVALLRPRPWPGPEPACPRPWPRRPSARP
jgi:hypothetical protein